MIKPGVVDWGLSKTAFMAVPDVSCLGMKTWRTRVNSYDLFERNVVS